jgi:hypothetical protein
MPFQSMLYMRKAEANGIDGVMNIINDQASEDYMADGMARSPVRRGQDRKRAEGTVGESFTVDCLV